MSKSGEADGCFAAPRETQRPADDTERTLGRSPAHVLLLHETDLAALFLPDLVEALRADGWTIVTADAAFADPIAPLAATVDVPSAQGTLIEAIAWERGLPEPRWWPGNEPEIARKRFEPEALHEEQRARFVASAARVNHVRQPPGLSVNLAARRGSTPPERSMRGGAICSSREAKDL